MNQQLLSRYARLFDYVACNSVAPNSCVLVVDTSIIHSH